MKANLHVHFASFYLDFFFHLHGMSRLRIFKFYFKKVTFIYGLSKSIRLTLNQDIEIVEKLQAHEKSWITIPEADLQRSDNESLLDHCPSLEVELSHSILKENVNIMVAPDCSIEQLSEILYKYMDNVLPIVVYAISEGILSDSVSNDLLNNREK